MGRAVWRKWGRQQQLQHGVCGSCHTQHFPHQLRHVNPSVHCMSANWPTIHHALTRQKGWARRGGEEREAEEVACSIVAMCSGSRKNKMPTSQQFRMLWCGAQNPPQVAPLQLSPPPTACHHSSATLCWTVATPANISIKQAAKSAQPKKGAHTVQRERVGVAEGGRASMEQLNDAYKLPASALNAFVSMSLPRHELLFTHSHSPNPALTLTLSYSLCLIRMQRRRAKSETVYQSEMTEKKRNNRDELQQRVGVGGERESGSEAEMIEGLHVEGKNSIRFN